MEHQYTDEGSLLSNEFNWPAAAIACVTVFLTVQAFAFGASKGCVTHFDPNLMFSGVLVALFVDWIIWIPLGTMCGFLAGRHICCEVFHYCIYPQRVCLRNLDSSVSRT